ncbi:DNA polymerase exonuclease subunit [Xylella phage Paz]|uniref:3'-5' exonuclease n=1 Tax=Xylella phage Paz TaxID=1415145 RepID=V5Q7Q0_9CAUD|nr:DNA polymerase exonuclease subunit [Xylella phage Paz]AHB12118.1 3'-5' exonuclease [Xylella phage Paz]
MNVTLKQLLKRAPKHGPKIICLDIETFPIEFYGWQMFNNNFSVPQIKRDWSLMSFSAEWLHDDGNFYIDQRREKDVFDDRKQAAALWAILDHADFILARNGKKFDLRKIKARLVILGFPPLSPVGVIDPMLLNRVEFAFTSHKLEYTTGVLVPNLRKYNHGKFPGFELWLACMQSLPGAWNECEQYNRIDVKSMKEEYLQVRGWYSQHPNIAVYYKADGSTHRCNKCGHDEMIPQDKPAYTQVGTYLLLQCTQCGGHSRARRLTTTIEERKHVTVPA